VVIDPKERKSLNADLSKIGLEYGNQENAALNLLTAILTSLNIPVGSSFVENTLGFSKWIKKNHENYSDIAWPTDLDQHSYGSG
jgi:hypothetical protein